MTDFSDDSLDAVTANPDAAHLEPVLLLNAGTFEEAEIVRLTLEAEGIPALLQNPDASAGTGMLGDSVNDFAANGVFVAPSDLARAQAVLNAAAPTEAELTAVEEADPMTLEEAEARVKDA